MIGRDPLDQKFRNFWFRSKWNGNFRKVHLENFGQPLEVVHFPEILELAEIFCSTWRFISVRHTPPPVSFAVRCRRQDGGTCVTPVGRDRFSEVEKAVPFDTRVFRKFKLKFLPKWIALIVYNVSKEGRLLIYILTEYFLNVIYSSEESKRKKEKDELRDVLARMKQMDELFKKREKEHMETVAAMQKRIEELEGTMKPRPILV